jgi:hypothetical protein
MRRREPMDPVVERELEALEAALTGAPGADPELAALTGELRAIAPRLRPGARRALDARVQAGFPRPERGRHERRWSGLRRGLLLPAGGVLAAAVVALVAVLGGGGSREDPVSSSAPSIASPESAARDSAGSTAGDAAGSAVPAPVAPQTAVAPTRRVERGVRLELGVRPARMDRVTDGVVRVTQRRGGFVAGSQIARDAGGGTATFTLRIPSARLDAAVADLSRLAHVRSIQQDTQDLTGSLDSVAGRLRDARTGRRAIVAALATATGDRATRLRARLADVTAQVQRLERERATLRSRTSYATVDLTVSAASGAVVTPGDGRWTVGDAWHDARRGLEVAAGVAVLALAVLVPVVLLAALAGLLLTVLRRRWREAAL